MNAEPAIVAGSVKDQVLQKVFKLGKCAHRSLIFRARISTDATVAVTLDALVRDRFLTFGADEVYSLTDSGFREVGQEPGSNPLPTATISASAESGKSKRCRTCHVPKPLEQFDRAPRSPDGRTLDCTTCRAQGLAVTVMQPKPPAPTVPSAPALPSTSESCATSRPAHENQAEHAVTGDPVFCLPTIIGVFAIVRGDEVFLSQPQTNSEPMRLTRERGLALGRWLCEHLGTQA